MTFLLGLIGATLGWIALEFIGKPFRRFFDLKREGLECLNLYANVEVPPISLAADDGFLDRAKTSPRMATEWKRLRKAEDEFRSHGSRFLAFAHTERLAVRALKLFGFDPEKAGNGFIGLSNTIGEYGEARHSCRKLVERSLRVDE